MGFGVALAFAVGRVDASTGIAFAFAVGRDLSGSCLPSGPLERNRGVWRTANVELDASYVPGAGAASVDDKAGCCLLRERPRAGSAAGAAGGGRRGGVPSWCILNKT